MESGCEAESARYATSLPVLRTRDLILRPVLPRDFDGMCRWLSAPQVAAWMSDLPYPFRPDDARQYVDQIGQAHAALWTITLGGEFVGQIGIGHELGYWLTPKAWGRGVATQAAIAALDHAFDNGRSVVVAGVHPENQASIRVLAKLGFVPFGITPGHFGYHWRTIKRPIYCLTATQWQSLSVAAE